MPFRLAMVIPRRSNVRIKKRPLPDYKDSDQGLIGAIKEDGFLNVALNDANQYGPHAMIVLLGIVSTITGILLLIAMNLI